MLDNRARQSKLAIPDSSQALWFDSTPTGRLKAEYTLYRSAGKSDLVLCFHNLPPILPVRGRVFCYVQNANLVNLIPRSLLTGWPRYRYMVERFIARQFKRRIDRYFVQTPTMKAALLSWFGEDDPPVVEVAPFIDSDDLLVDRPPHVRKQWDFLYAADGASHKNHANLLSAWKLLGEEGIFPSLALTLPPRDSALIDRIEALKVEHGLNITNLGYLPHDDLLQCYHQAGAMLFASYAESFGIPLLEAKAADLPIIAAELDFVRDMCEPVQTFDPFSERSIAGAVKRHLKLTADQVKPLEASAFVALLSNL
tara:strand:+ start:26680 stop:27612 length:933 start_codon:yes stop_codon:yes gene_type:complete